MSAVFRHISSVPGIAIPFHLAGPLAFYGGLLTLIVQLMKRPSITRWSGMLAVLGIVAVGAQAITGYALLALRGFAGMSVGLISVAWMIVKRANG
jgi:hypothetical protein